MLPVNLITRNTPPPPPTLLSCHIGATQYPFHILPSYATPFVARQATEIELKLTINYEVRVLWWSFWLLQENTSLSCHPRWCWIVDDWFIMAGAGAGWRWTAYNVSIFSVVTSLMPCWSQNFPAGKDVFILLLFRKPLKILIIRCPQACCFLNRCKMDNVEWLSDFQFWADHS